MATQITLASQYSLAAWNALPLAKKAEVTALDMRQNYVEILMMPSYGSSQEFELGFRYKEKFCTRGEVSFEDEMRVDAKHEIKKISPGNAWEIVHKQDPHLKNINLATQVMNYYAGLMLSEPC